MQNLIEALPLLFTFLLGVVAIVFPAFFKKDKVKNFIKILDTLKDTLIKLEGLEGDPAVTNNEQIIEEINKIKESLVNK